MRALASLAALVVMISGCAESVLIKSSPAGAKAYLDGQPIGSTPAWGRIPRRDMDRPHTWRVEYRDCDPAEGTLQTGVAPGRIVGYVFTLGILAIFKSPNYYRHVDALLSGGDCGGGPRPPAGAAAPQSPEAQALAQRLETLRDLYDRKLISKSVYEAETQKAVREFTTP